MEDKKPSNPSAFPTTLENCGWAHDNKSGHGFEGMTLRDYFAAKAMQGHLANSAESDVSPKYIFDRLGLPKETVYVFAEHYPQYIAKLSFMYADAMLAEREREITKSKNKNGKDN